MLFKSNCPNCGAHTYVDLEPYEAKIFYSTGKLPDDFLNRSVCDCCSEDGFEYFDYCYELLKCNA